MPTPAIRTSTYPLERPFSHVSILNTPRLPLHAASPPPSSIHLSVSLQHAFANHRTRHGIFQSSASSQAGIGRAGTGIDGMPSPQSARRPTGTTPLSRQPPRHRLGPEGEANAKTKPEGRAKPLNRPSPHATLCRPSRCSQSRSRASAPVAGVPRSERIAPAATNQGRQSCESANDEAEKLMIADALNQGGLRSRDRYRREAPGHGTEHGEEYRAQRQ